MEHESVSDIKRIRCALYRYQNNGKETERLRN